MEVRMLPEVLAVYMAVAVAEVVVVILTLLVALEVVLVVLVVVVLAGKPMVQVVQREQLIRVAAVAAALLIAEVALREVQE
jgi:hypothetical protein